MKFCPYCGASLAGGAASFCAECGKALPISSDMKLHSAETPARPRSDSEKKTPVPAGKPKPPQNLKPAGTARQPQRLSRPRPAPKKAQQSRRDPVYQPKPDPRDEGYDGYYDDVKPIDNGHTRDRADPELIKRIILLSVGAFIIVMFSVIIMYLL